ncbi:fumarylacetoacetate hydrolase family protein (plasmid) [Skermanella mucosa]|uniref:fumarylacetoacetate hydrolase family protein n=1 Tax=Skermanella mucosa TaxID=1789672 RepID=UPI00192A848A|nr:fumarylacetoacetate hydrolase family protein [Skermanella mucosa]UEM24679.1 fumarylacetoacetate hydrolase family protein [Skermanella mucosa]
MKFATFQMDGRTAVGLVEPENGRIWPLEALLGEPVDDMVDLIRRYDQVKERIRPAGRAVDLASVRIMAPIPRPARNVMCVGKNYHDHAHEFARSGFDSSARGKADAVPEFPIIFTKVPESVIADGEPIRYPDGISDSIDYEAEVTVIIGKGGRGITREQAYRHVWGYTIINDVTARDIQGRHKQWFLGKSFDTFCPMGPWVVTADEIDPASLAVRCWVNDELRQDANTRDLIFDIPTLIETISAGITLVPGDVIATGTPAGVGIGFDPPKYLKRGDRVAIEVEGIGRLANTLG